MDTDKYCNLYHVHHLAGNMELELCSLSHAVSITFLGSPFHLHDSQFELVAWKPCWELISWSNRGVRGQGYLQE